MSEIYRKLFRLLGLIFPILYFFINKNDLLIILLLATLLFITIDILRFKFPKVNQGYFKYFFAISKKKEEKTFSGTTYVLISSLLTVLLFKKEIAITAIFFLILGDAAASLIGLKYGRTKIFDKSLEGSLACFLTCSLAGIILSLNLSLSSFSVILGAAAATLAELFPLRVDDNLTMALISGLMMSLFSK